MADTKRSVFDALTRLIDHAEGIDTANVIRTCDMIDEVARWQYSKDSSHASRINDGVIDAICLLVSKAVYFDTEKHNRICATIEALIRLQRRKESADLFMSLNSSSLEWTDRSATTHDFVNFGPIKRTFDHEQDNKDDTDTDTTAIKTPDASTTGVDEASARPPYHSHKDQSVYFPANSSNSKEGPSANAGGKVHIPSHDPLLFRTSQLDRLKHRQRMIDSFAAFQYIPNTAGIASPEYDQIQRSHNDMIRAYDHAFNLIGLNNFSDQVHDHERKDQRVQTSTGAPNTIKDLPYITACGPPTYPYHFNGSTAPKAFERKMVHDLSDFTAKAQANTTNLSKLVDPKARVGSMETPDMVSKKTPTTVGVSSMEAQSAGGPSASGTSLPNEVESIETPLEERLQRLISQAERGDYGSCSDEDLHILRRVIHYCPFSLLGLACWHGNNCTLVQKCFVQLFGECEHGKACLRDHELQATCPSILKRPKCKAKNCPLNHDQVVRRAMDSLRSEHKEGLYGVQRPRLQTA